MAMNVTSSTNSAKLQQSQQSQQSQAQQAAAKARNVAKEQPPKQTQEAHKPEQPKPVVNTQGQVTGKRINVTA